MLLGLNAKGGDKLNSIIDHNPDVEKNILKEINQIIYLSFVKSSHLTIWPPGVLAAGVEDCGEIRITTFNTKRVELKDLYWSVVKIESFREGLPFVFKSVEDKEVDEFINFRLASRGVNLSDYDFYRGSILINIRSQEGVISLLDQYQKTNKGLVNIFNENIIFDDRYLFFSFGQVSLDNFPDIRIKNGVQNLAADYQFVFSRKKCFYNL